MSIAETDSSIFLAVFGLEFFYSTWCGLSIQMIHPRWKLKEKTQWWINYHFIEIDNTFERILSSQWKEKKISIKLMIDIHLLDDSIEFLNLKESIRWKMKFINWKFQFNTNNFHSKQSNWKYYLFVIDFVHYQIVIFIILIIFKQKSDKIHWIDYFWTILVKKRNFCLFECFLKWRWERFIKN